MVAISNKAIQVQILPHTHTLIKQAFMGKEVENDRTAGFVSVMKSQSSDLLVALTNKARSLVVDLYERFIYCNISEAGFHAF